MEEKANGISVEAISQLENDAEFQELVEKTRRLNVFEVLGITKTEIRHSNFLAWLLDPKEAHGLGDRFLRAFAAKVGEKEKLPADTSDCIVRREWMHIDLLAICPTAKYLLCIENKVFSGEHGDQLKNYRDCLLKEYEDFTMSFVFLSPEGLLPKKVEDQPHWQPISYSDMLEAIETARRGEVLSEEVNMLLDHYIAAVRRHIVGDENIIELCQKVYDRHKEVLELIYENCKTDIAPMRAAVEGWCKKKNDEQALIFDPQFSNNTYTRFTTGTIRALFPQHEKPISGWKSTDMAFYEIVKRDDYFKVTLSLCSDNITNEQREACDLVSKALDRPDKKETWRWKRIQNWDRYPIDAEPGSIEYDVEVQKALDENWGKIQKFERELKEKLK